MDKSDLVRGIAVILKELKRASSVEVRREPKDLIGQDQRKRYERQNSKIFENTKDDISSFGLSQNPSIIIQMANLAQQTQAP